MSETFKDIKGYEGLYQVSNLGRVKSLRRWNAGERILKSIKNKNGYYRVHLLKNGNSKNFYIHRLVVGAFLENKENKPCTNHKNGIKADNRAENLEHCTIGENNKHAFRTGIRKNPVGENASNAKLNEKQVRVIKHLKNIKPKMSQCAIAKIFGVHYSMIGLIYRGKRWKHIKFP